MTAFQGQDRILLYSYSICTECPEVRKTISSADQYPVGEDRWRQQVESRVEKKKQVWEQLNTPVSFLNPFRVDGVCSHFCLKQREWIPGSMLKYTNEPHS